MAPVRLGVKGKPCKTRLAQQQQQQHYFIVVRTACVYLFFTFLSSLLVTHNLRTPCGSCFRRQFLCVAEAVVRTLS